MAKAGRDRAHGRDDGNDGLSHPAPSLRIDLFLWRARLSRTRSAAQELAMRGLIRLNGRRVERPHIPVRTGDILTLPIADGGAHVLRVAALPARRGPPAEAATLCIRIESATIEEGTGPIRIDARQTAQ